MKGKRVKTKLLVDGIWWTYWFHTEYKDLQRYIEESIIGDYSVGYYSNIQDLQYNFRIENRDYINPDCLFLKISVKEKAVNVLECYDIKDLNRMIKLKQL